jgi:hypothetical protein
MPRSWIFAQAFKWHFPDEYQLYQPDLFGKCVLCESELMLLLLFAPVWTRNISRSFAAFLFMHSLATVNISLGLFEDLGPNNNI